jgi:fido (protein-threonine AMPylation protein)
MQSTNNTSRIARKLRATIPAWKIPPGLELIHPFTDGNGRVGRALLNFILERAGYPTLYLGLRQRREYLDAIAPADDGDFGPIMKMLSSTYTGQHKEITRAMKSVKGNRKSDWVGALSKEFVRMKKRVVEKSSESRS